MVIKCEEILKLPVAKGMRLLGGEQGLDRLITWTVVYTSSKSFENLTGGELIIFTGDTIRGRGDILQKEMENCLWNNCSAAIIMDDCHLTSKVYKYMEEWAKKMHFPIFYADSKIRIIDIETEISRMLLMDNNVGRQMFSLLREIIFQDNIPLTDALCTAECFGFHSNENYIVAIIKNVEREKNESKNNYIYQVYHNYFVTRFTNIMSMYWKDMLVILFCMEEGENEKSIEKKLLTAYEYVNTSYPKVRVDIGIGREVKHLKLVNKSFYEALRVVDTISLLPKNDEKIVKHYKDLGFFRIMFEMKDTTGIRELYKETLGEVEEYDLENNTNLLETLEVYIENNCNIDSVSELLYIHKNSVRYRLTRVEEITGSSLKDIETLGLFFFCFKVKKFLVVV